MAIADGCTACHFHSRRPRGNCWRIRPLRWRLDSSRRHVARLAHLLPDFSNSILKAHGYAVRCRLKRAPLVQREGRSTPRHMVAAIVTEPLQVHRLLPPRERVAPAPRCRRCARWRRATGSPATSRRPARRCSTSTSVTERSQGRVLSTIGGGPDPAGARRDAPIRCYGRDGMMRTRPARCTGRRRAAESSIASNSTAPACRRWSGE